MQPKEVSPPLRPRHGRSGGMTRLAALLAPWALIAAILIVLAGRLSPDPHSGVPAARAQQHLRRLGRRLAGPAAIGAENTLVMSLEAWIVAILIATPLAMLTALSPLIERGACAHRRHAAGDAWWWPSRRCRDLGGAGASRAGDHGAWPPSSPSSRSSPARSPDSPRWTRTLSGYSTFTAPAACNACSACAYPPPCRSGWRGPR